MADPLVRISRARLALIVHCPFLGSVALRLRPRVAVPEDRVSTAAVAGDGTLVVNAAYVATLHPAELAAVVGHEVMHVVLEHHRRCGKRDPAGWNIACDATINLVVAELGEATQGRVVLPSDAILEYSLHGLSSEEIYERLRRQVAPRSEPSGDLRDDLAETSDGHAAHAGDVAAARRLAAEWRVALAQAAQAHAASGRGSLPGSILRLIDSALGPNKVSWRETLSRWIGDHARRAELTYLRPSRRSESAGVMLPGPRRKSGLPDVVVMLDTSGSIDDRRLGDALAEVDAICEELGLGTRALIFDATVHADLEIEEARELFGRLKGGGGSDARPAFERLTAEGLTGLRGVLAIVFTDGDLHVPHVAPEVLRGVLWVLGEGDGGAPAAWGDVIRLPKARGPA